LVTYKLVLNKERLVDCIELLNDDTLSEGPHINFFIKKTLFSNEKHLLAKIKYEFCIGGGGYLQSYCQLDFMHQYELYLIYLLYSFNAWRVSWCVSFLDRKAAWCCSKNDFFV